MSEGPERRFFDVWSRFYDLPAVQRAIYRPVQDAVVTELERRPVSRVLDVGCGTGLLTARLQRELRATEVVGCDFSFGMIEQAAGRPERVAWVQGDAQHLPLHDACVDAVMSTESFHWYPDQAAALSEFHRVLSPGGRLLVALVNPWGPLSKATAEATAQAAGQPARWPTRWEMRRAVEAAGFQVRQQRRVVRVLGVLVPTVLTVAVR